jgi:hypothetical protein
MKENRYNKSFPFLSRRRFIYNFTVGIDSPPYFKIKFKWQTI